MLAFVALVINKYDLEIVSGGRNGGIPRQDEQKPTLGVVSPVKGDDLIVRFKTRAQ